MSIKSIDVINVLVFERQWRIENGDPKQPVMGDAASASDGFHLDFSDGINVLIGGNGVGKTSLLKMIYASTQWSNKQVDSGKTKKLLHFFSDHLKNSQALKNSDHQEGYCAFTVSNGEQSFEYSLSHEGVFHFEEWLGLNIQSVFIPTTEMLSHAKGFLAMNQKYNMPFDGTQIDIIVNASLPETKEVTPTMRRIMRKLGDVIQGTVEQNEDIFYIVKNDGRKVDFSLEAEGYRKFGLLWKLIRNGLLEPGSILLWDEPEANLNPELFSILADVLLELAANGVQIFLATHSYNFAKYLEIRRKEKEQVMFHNLYWGTPTLPETLGNVLPEKEHSKRVVYSSSGYRLGDLRSNHIMIADEKLLNEVYGLEDLDA